MREFADLVDSGRTSCTSGGTSVSGLPCSRRRTTARSARVVLDEIVRVQAAPVLASELHRIAQYRADDGAFR